MIHVEKTTGAITWMEDGASPLPLGNIADANARRKARLVAEPGELAHFSIMQRDGTRCPRCTRNEVTRRSMVMGASIQTGWCRHCGLELVETSQGWVDNRGRICSVPVNPFMERGVKW